MNRADPAGRFRSLRNAYLVLFALLIVGLGLLIARQLRVRSELHAHPEVEERLERSKELVALYEGHRPGPLPEDRLVRYQAVGAEPESDDPDSTPWTVSTFGQVPAEAFKHGLPDGPPPEGVVRILFLGGSTTHSGYPDRTAAALNRRLGVERVQAVNLGLNGSDSATSTVLLRRFGVQLRGRMVVVYHGFNDLTEARRAGGVTEALRSVGLAPHPFHDPAVRAEAVRNLIARYAALADEAERQGIELYISTFAMPDVDSLSPADQGRFEAEIRTMFRSLRSLEEYRRDLGEYNDALRAFAAARGLPLIDVARRHPGEAAAFLDLCHRNEAALSAHAEIAADALEPGIRRLLIP